MAARIPVVGPLSPTCRWLGAFALCGWPSRRTRHRGRSIAICVGDRYYPGDSPFAGWVSADFYEAAALERRRELWLSQPCPAGAPPGCCCYMVTHAAVRLFFARCSCSTGGGTAHGPCVLLLYTEHAFGELQFGAPSAMAWVLFAVGSASRCCSSPLCAVTEDAAYPHAHGGACSGSCRWCARHLLCSSLSREHRVRIARSGSPGRPPEDLSRGPLARFSLRTARIGRAFINSLVNPWHRDPGGDHSLAMAAYPLAHAFPGLHCLRGPGRQPDDPQRGGPCAAGSSPRRSAGSAAIRACTSRAGGRDYVRSCCSLTLPCPVTSRNRRAHGAPTPGKFLAHRPAAPQTCCRLPSPTPSPAWPNHFLWPLIAVKPRDVSLPVALALLLCAVPV